MKPYRKSNKNDFLDAEAIAEAVTKQNMRFVTIKTEEQLDVQTMHRVRDRLVQRRTALVISFGMDCSAEGPASFFGTLCTDPTPLMTKAGWDKVTSVGTPNAKAFADSFHP